MNPARPPKKTGTIEIRLPDETKAAFMEQCRQDDRTASEAIRAFIDAQIMPAPSRNSQRPSTWRLITALIFGAALGAGIAAPSLAQSASNARPAFEQADRNHDGQLSFEEFQNR